MRHRRCEDLLGGCLWAKIENYHWDVQERRRGGQHAAQLTATWGSSVTNIIYKTESEKHESNRKDHQKPTASYLEWRRGDVLPPSMPTTFWSIRRSSQLKDGPGRGDHLEAGARGLLEALFGLALFGRGRASSNFFRRRLHFRNS